MAEIDERLINEITEKVKRELMASPRFLSSLLQGVVIKAENIDPNYSNQILALMALNNYKQPPVPKDNKPKNVSEQKDGKSCAKPITVGDDSMVAKILADLLVGNNVYLWGKAGTGKTYLAKAVAECVLRQETYLINCSQWTSPIEIRGGQTIKGYTEGTLIKAWANGGMLILDELPKLDPNTAGLLNEALAEAAELPKYDKNNKVIEGTIPFITNGRGEKIYKGQDVRGSVNEFRFCVIGTGNTDMKTASKNYSGNQRQDYSLVDRFAGSYYYIEAQKETERQLTYPYVFSVADALRNFLNKQKDALESISLRTMLNFNRTYEQEMLLKCESPYADTIYDNDGNVLNTTKTFSDAITSLVKTLPPAMQTALAADQAFQMVYGNPPSKDDFKAQFQRIYGMPVK
jgi:hypothetical protein